MVKQAAFHSRAPEQPLSQGRSHQGEHAAAAGRLPADRNLLRVAAKGGDVVPYPFEGKNLIIEAIIARDAALRFGRQLRMGEKAQDAQPIIEGDDDHTRSG